MTRLRSVTADTDPSVVTVDADMAPEALSAFLSGLARGLEERPDVGLTLIIAPATREGS